MKFGTKCAIMEKIANGEDVSILCPKGNEEETMSEVKKLISAYSKYLGKVTINNKPKGL